MRGLRDAAPAAPSRSVRGVVARGVARFRSRPAFWSFLLGIVVSVAAYQIAADLPFADVLIRPLLRPDTSGRAAAIVVPGGGVSDACTPNVSSLHRTLLASRLYQEKRAPVIVFLGGAPKGLACSVADVMAALARQVGVPPADIRVENQSRSTWENAAFSMPILRAMNAERVLIVTDRLHIARAEGVFAHFGLSVERATVPIHETYDDNIGMLAQAAREYGASFYYRMRGRLTPNVAASGVAGSAALAVPPEHLVTQSLAHPDGPIVILGASYVADWRLRTAGGHSVINRGVNGQKSFELLERFTKDVVDQRPRAVIIWGYINDIFAAPSAKTEAAVERAKASVETMVAEARRHGIEPVVATEVTIGPPKSLRETIAGIVNGWRGREGYQARINTQVLAMNRWLRELAKREGLLLLDLQPVLAEASGMRRSDFATEDGSHITPAGYEAITKSVIPVLEAHFRERR